MLSNIEYVSSGCNNVPHTLAVRKDELIYAACNGIIIVDVKHDQLVAKRTLTGHTERVNCVRWISDDSFVSGSSDKKVILWSKQEISAKLEGHTGSVTVADGLKEKGLIISASTDSTLKFWERQQDDTWNCFQTFICPKSGFALDVKVIECEDKDLWIFASFDDCSIRLFCKSQESSKYFKETDYFHPGVSHRNCQG